MGNPIRVLVLGTGQMGSGICRMLGTKRSLALAGAFQRRVHLSGPDLGWELGVPVSHDLKRLIAETKPQLAIQATCSRLAEVIDDIETLVRHGVHIISIAEEMAYPAASSPFLAQKLQELALAHGVGILGTGVNPGFVLDLLIICLSGVCADIRSITAQRVNDLAPYGPTVLASQGVGLSPEQFQDGLSQGTIAGHFGFRESIHMITDALGWQIDRIEESNEPIISKVRRQTSFVTVEPGQVAGCFHQAVAYQGERMVIRLSHPQQIHPHLAGVTTGDSIKIKGNPDIRLSGSPEIPGGVATCALAVNMIPLLLDAGPGLYSMADLPVPRAMLGDTRHLYQKKREEQHG